MTGSGATDSDDERTGDTTSTTGAGIETGTGAATGVATAATVVLGEAAWLEVVEGFVQAAPAVFF